MHSYGGGGGGGTVVVHVGDELCLKGRSPVGSHCALSPLV